MANFLKGLFSSSKEKKQQAAPEAAALEQPPKNTFLSSTAIEKKARAEENWAAKLKQGLKQTSSQLNQSLFSVLNQRKLKEETLQDLEDILIQADLGTPTAAKIVEILEKKRYDKAISLKEVQHIMAEEIGKILQPLAVPLSLDLSAKPYVIIFVGVNGSGKTTTIGKLAAQFKQQGLKTMLAAGDTFRAAAIEQLVQWGEKINVPVISSKLGADAASLAHEAYHRAVKEHCDVLLIDTAGRLQNKTELMQELAKIIRVLKKQNANLPHKILQILDATTGQNALRQVQIFKETAGVNGLVMTKLDGTAKGGILVAIAAEHALPIHFIGTGEKVEDLSPFSAQEFAQNLTQNDHH